MGCLPFCCCMKNISPKQFVIAGLICSGIKAILSLIGIILIFSILLSASSFYIVEFLFIISTLVQLIILTINTFNGSIYDKNNKMGKILCIIVLSIGGVILLIRLIALILSFLAIAITSSSKYMLIILIPTILVFALEIIQFLAVNYFYKLISLKSNVSYNEYIKNGQNVDQVSVTITNTPINQNPPIFPYNNPNQIPGSSQENSEGDTNKNIK